MSKRTASSETRPLEPLELVTAEDPHLFRLQVLSDIHLEYYPADAPFVVKPCAPVLALLGDIGYASDYVEEVGAGTTCDDVAPAIAASETAPPASAAESAASGTGLGAGAGTGAGAGSRGEACSGGSSGDHSPHAGARSPQPTRKNEGDALRAFLRAQSAAFEHVLFVPGNHEFYHTSQAAGLEWLATECAALPNVHLLHRRSLTLNGIRVLGCTLWTRIPTRCRSDAWARIRDFDRITELDVAGDLTAVPRACKQWLAWHVEDAEWLREGIDAAAEGGETAVILTHHAPTKTACINPAEVAAGYAELGMHGTSLEGMCEPHVAAWAFGHTHYNCDWRHPTTGTRFVTNQVGYPDGSDGMPGAEGYEPYSASFVLELPVAPASTE